MTHNIISDALKVPDGFPQPVGPTIAAESGRVAQDVWKVLTGVPEYLAVTLPLGAVEVSGKLLGKIALAGPYGAYWMTKIAGHTREKIHEVLSFKWLLGGGGHGHDAHAAGAHGEHAPVH